MFEDSLGQPYDSPGDSAGSAPAPIRSMFMEIYLQAYFLFLLYQASKKK